MTGVAVAQRRCGAGRTHGGAEVGDLATDDPNQKKPNPGAETCALEKRGVMSTGKKNGRGIGENSPGKEDETQMAASEPTVVNTPM